MSRTVRRPALAIRDVLRESYDHACEWAEDFFTLILVALVSLLLFPLFLLGLCIEWAAYYARRAFWFIAERFLFCAPAALLLASSACADIHDIPATKGGTYTHETFSAPSPSTATSTRGTAPSCAPTGLLTRETFRQPENAAGTSTFSRASDGTIKVSLGKTTPNSIAIAPPPDYTRYIALVLGALLALGGGIVAYLGWVTIGQRMMFGGVGACILALTVGEYGWLYAIALVAFAVWLGIEKYLSETEREKEVLGAVDSVSLRAGADTTATRDAVKAILP